MGARLPSIVASCAMLVAVYELGSCLGDWTLGLVGAFVCGTTFLFLKFAWQAEYDLHLALWVTVANWCLAAATFQNRRWSGCLGAGAAMGLALMSKGPVAIVQIALPWVAYLAWRKWKWKLSLPGQWAKPLIGGAALCLLISLPWVLYAFYLLGVKRMLGIGVNEVTLGTERGYETRTTWHAYIVFFPMMLPWLVWFLSGFIEIIRRQVSARKLWLAIFWLLVPILVMQFFVERRDRYLLPMIGPAAIIAAYGVLQHLPRWGKWNAIQKAMVVIHAIGLLAIVFGLAVLGHFRLTTVDGAPWYDTRQSAIFCIASVAICFAAVWIYRHFRAGLIGGTVCLMLMTNLFFLMGYRNSSNGRSEGKTVADEILGAYPDAAIYNAAPQNRSMLPLELLIYLDRDVPELKDADSLAPSNRPQVLIYPPGPVEVQPIPPAGFNEFIRQPINTGIYHVFVRPGG